MFCFVIVCFFFFKQKTAYEMRISDWSSDVCSSDLARASTMPKLFWSWEEMLPHNKNGFFPYTPGTNLLYGLAEAIDMLHEEGLENVFARHDRHAEATRRAVRTRSEEHTSELQSLMRSSYAVLCLKKKKQQHYQSNQDTPIDTSTNLER